MASFQIADGPVSVPLPEAGGKRVGSARFSVTNTRGERRIAMLTVRPDASAEPAWFTIEDGTNRDFEPGETRLVTVRVTVPTSAPAGEHRFAVRVLDETDPNNDWADSAGVRFTIPIAPANPPAAPLPDSHAPIYVDEERRIDREFARFGARSIPVSQIDGIELKAKRSARKLAIGLLLLSGLLLLAAFEAESWFLIFTAMAAAAAAMFCWLRRHHLLLVTTSGHESEVVRSQDKVLVAKIRDALECAVAARSRA